MVLFNKLELKAHQSPDNRRMRTNTVVAGSPEEERGRYKLDSRIDICIKTFKLRKLSQIENEKLKKLRKFRIF